MAYLGRKAALAGLTSADIPDNSITAAKIVADTIAAGDIGDDAVGTAELANDVVISTSGAITTTGAFTSVGIDDNADANAITIDANESVGIGVTPSASYSLDVKNSLSVQGAEGVSAALYLRADEGDDDGDTWRIISNHDVNDLTLSNNTSGSYVDKITFLKTGEVGIGTATPLGGIDLRGTYTAPSSDIGNSAIFCASSEAATSSADKGGVIQFGGNYTGTTPTQWAGIVGLKDNNTDANYAGYMAFYTRAQGAAPVERMRIDSVGKVGIGTTSADRQLHIDSGDTEVALTLENNAQKFKIGVYDFGTDDDRLFIHAHQSGSDELKLSSGGALWIRGALTENSDERLKTNIQTITSALSKVTQMRGVSYDRIDNDESTVGLIAQELEIIAPELVHTEVGSATTGDTPPLENLKSISYTNLVAYLIEAVKELSAKNDALEAENTAMKTRMDALEARVTALEG